MRRNKKKMFKWGLLLSALTKFEMPDVKTLYLCTVFTEIDSLRRDADRNIKRK